MKYSLNLPSLSHLEKKYVNDVLKKNWLSINGIHTQIFEKKFCNFLGRKFGLAVQSGTAALHATLKGIGIKKGDKVIIPNYTCVSNISSVSQCNAIPIIVDIESATLGLNYELVCKAIEKYKPKALQLVHVYGFPARDTKKIIQLCKKKKIIVIEDSSESLGATINNRYVGTFGDIAIFSIRSEKMIGVGEGGMIVTNNKNFFKSIKTICSRSAPFRASIDPYWKKYFTSGEGYNYLMPHLLGAVGRAQIERFAKQILPKKIAVGLMYRKIFKNKNFEFSQKLIPGFKSSFWLNSIYFKNFSQKKIIKIGNKLMKIGIEVRSGFWPLNKLKGFKSYYVKKNKSVTEEIFRKTLVLPSNCNLTVKDLKTIKKKLVQHLK